MVAIWYSFWMCKAAYLKNGIFGLPEFQVDLWNSHTKAMNCIQYASIRNTIIETLSSHFNLASILFYSLEWFTDLIYL